MMNGTGAGTASFAPGGVQRIAVRSWRPAGIPWSRLADRYSTLFYRSNLSEIIAQGDYDLVHLHNPLPALEMWRVARACLARGIPYVVSTHGINEVANGSRIYGFDRLRRLAWERLVVAPVSRVVRKANAIFALSPADVPIVRAMGFRGNPDIVCNGVPMPPPPAPGADAAALRRLGIPVERRPGQITCMFLANHTPNKGLPQLLEAITRLRQPCLLIVGGERRDAIEYERYLRACKPGQEIIVTGRVGDDDVAAMFRRSDLFVFPTLADTFPLVVSGGDVARATRPRHPRRRHSASGGRHLRRPGRPRRPSAARNGHRHAGGRSHPSAPDGAERARARRRRVRMGTRGGTRDGRLPPRAGA
jgi:starch synthase